MNDTSMQSTQVRTTLVRGRLHSHELETSSYSGGQLTKSEFRHAYDGSKSDVRSKNSSRQSLPSVFSQDIVMVQADWKRNSDMTQQVDEGSDDIRGDGPDALGARRQGGQEVEEGGRDKVPCDGGPVKSCSARHMKRLPALKNSVELEN